MAREFIPIRTVMTGSAFLVDSSRRGHVEAYHQRIQSGKIFGPRTDEFLPPGNTTTERIEQYFNEVDSRLNDLGSVYGLNERFHTGGDFADIKEEASRIMWNYGITTDVFADHQRGLFLLGAASMSLSLRGREGKVFEQERGRMKHIVRMIAFSANSHNFSVKVEEWGKRTGTKARDDRAKIESQYTASNSELEDSASWLEKAYLLKDEDASTLLNQEYRSMPHIQRVRRQLSGNNVPVEWVVTNQTLEEFKATHGGAEGVALGRTIIVPRKRGIELEQHEFAHTQAEYQATFYLGYSILEADAERLVDNPTVYSRERLLGYYVDDVLDSKFGKVGTRGAEQIRRTAAQKRFKILNSPEEIAWSRSLIETFGLEGYLTYYMVNTYTDQASNLVKSQLLDVPHGVFRLKVYKEFYEGSSDLPVHFYEGRSDYGAIMNDILVLWQNSDARNRNMMAQLVNIPFGVGAKLSTDVLVALSQRLNTLRQIYTGLSPRWERPILQLDEYAWMKQRYPHVFDTEGKIWGRYPAEIFDAEAKPFVISSIEESQMKDIQIIAKNVEHQLDILKDRNVYNYHNSLRYIFLRLAFGEYSPGIDRELQRQLGEGLLLAHKRIVDEVEWGDRQKVIERIREEILEPLARGKLSGEALVTLLNGVPQVV